jgi:hypothetical protein
MSQLTDLEKALPSAVGTFLNQITNPVAQASAAGANTFTYQVTVVSGTAAMVDITVPFPGFQGRITLLPTGAFTWTAAGNIAVLGTAVVGRALDFVYNPVTAKWYPSYV